MRMTRLAKIASQQNHPPGAGGMESGIGRGAARSPARRAAPPGTAPRMPALRTPLFDWHASHGARIVEFGGWEMPLLYAGIVEEHLAVRRGAGLFDVSHMGKLVLEGPGATALVN